MPDTSRRTFLAGAFSTVAAVRAAHAQSSPLAERLAPPKGRVDAVLDTDTYNEIDDQFAVAYALRSPERMRIEAVYAALYLNDRSTSAGDGMRKSYEEIERILGRLKVDTRDFAYRGSEQFMAGASKPVDSPAARDLIAKALKPRSGPLYVLTVGAPTNVSSAILMEPKIKDRIVVVWLGGQPYDWSTAREFNLEQDLHASRILHDSGVAMVNIPTQNVSEHITTTVPEMQYFLQGKSPIADYLLGEFIKFAKEHSKWPAYSWSKVIWDISAVAWVANPQWVPTKVVSSPRLTDDYKYERVPGWHEVRVATDCRRDPIFHDLFQKLARA